MTVLHLAVLLLSVCLFGCSSLTLLWHGRSIDRRVAVRVEQHLSSQRVLIDGVPGSNYDAVGYDGLAISPDGQRVAYPARRGKQWIMVIQTRWGEERSKAWDGLAETRWSGDSRHLAYAAELEERWYVVFDGEAGSPWSHLRKDTLSVSRDGRRLVFVAEKNDKVFAVIDRKVHGPYTTVTQLQISSDGAAAGYVALKADKHYAVVNGVHSTPHSELRKLEIVRGGRFGYLAEDGGRWQTYIDGVVQGQPCAAASELVFSPDGSSWVYLCKLAGKSFVIHDGRSGVEHSSILPGSLAFSPRGHHLTYIARKGKRLTPVIDGQVGPAFDELELPVFSSRDARWGYIGRRQDRTTIVLEGLPDRFEEWASNLNISPDGLKLVYIAERNGKTLIVHPGGESAYDVIIEDSITFSEDSQHWACLVGDASTQQLFVTIDGTMRRPFELDELVTAQMREQTPKAQQLVGARLIDNVVKAELDLAIESVGH